MKSVHESAREIFARAGTFLSILYIYKCITCAQDGGKRNQATPKQKKSDNKEKRCKFSSLLPPS